MHHTALTRQNLGCSDVDDLDVKDDLFGDAADLAREQIGDIKSLPELGQATRFLAAEHLLLAFKVDQGAQVSTCDHAFKTTV